MKLLVCLLAAVVLAATACQAGEGFASADAGVFLLLGQNPAESLNGFAGGVSYRPSYVDGFGIEQESRLLFTSSVGYNGEFYLMIGTHYRWADFEGVGVFTGANFLALEDLAEETRLVEPGVTGELRCEFDSALGPTHFIVGSGYVWREPVREDDSPNAVPLYVKLGARTK